MVSSTSKGLMTKKIFSQREKSQTALKSQITMLKCIHRQCDGRPACTGDKMEAGGSWMVHHDLTEVTFTALGEKKDVGNLKMQAKLYEHRGHHSAI